MTDLPTRPLRIAVVGAGDAAPDACDLAREVGRALASAGALVVCGGRGGVMEAVARGAAEGGGSCLGVLPGPSAADASPWVDIPLPTGLGEARNALIVRGAEAVIAVTGGWGTLSEIALARKMGRPVTTVGPAPMGVEGVHRSEGAGEAVAWALDQAETGRGLRARTTHV